MTESTEVMENKLLELEGKLRTLKVTVNKSDQVSETGNLEVITRHEALITTKIEASYALKVSIEEIKFIKKEPEDEIQAWVKDIEEQLRIADERAFVLRRLKERIVKERQ